MFIIIIIIVFVWSVVVCQAMDTSMLDKRHGTWAQADHMYSGGTHQWQWSVCTAMLHDMAWSVQGHEDGISTWALPPTVVSAAMMGTGSVLRAWSMFTSVCLACIHKNAQCLFLYHHHQHLHHHQFHHEHLLDQCLHIGGWLGNGLIVLGLGLVCHCL